MKVPTGSATHLNEIPKTLMNIYRGGTSMQPGKKLLQAAWALGLGLMLLAPAGGLAMDAADAPETVEIESWQSSTDQ